jgi:predicted nucleic acid-binding protein
MSTLVLLDAAPLGAVTNPAPTTEAREMNAWLENLLRQRTRVFVPEIADYEVRRELLRARKTQGIGRLDSLAARLEYLPLTTAVMRQAAEFWATARQRGRPTAPDHALDGDVILAAQATLIGGGGNRVVVATSNVGHLSLFVEARLWRDIKPDE